MEIAGRRDSAGESVLGGTPRTTTATALQQQQQQQQQVGGGFGMETPQQQHGMGFAGTPTTVGTAATGTARALSGLDGGNFAHLMAVGERAGVAATAVDKGLVSWEQAALYFRRYVGVVVVFNLGYVVLWLTFLLYSFFSGSVGGLFSVYLRPCLRLC